MKTNIQQEILPSELARLLIESKVKTSTAEERFKAENKLIKTK